MSAMMAVSLASLVAWLVLLFGRGFFWRVENDPPAAAPAVWPEVVAVVPARDEAEGIGRAVSSLLTQDYPGLFRVIVVDDNSSDGTADLARAAALEAGAAERLEVVTGKALPAGWAGKVWAMEQGCRRAKDWTAGAKYVLFTDADIRHASGQLRDLVARAEGGGYDLTSLMVRLHCSTFPERMMIPAFVFFFRMLYPFRWIADPRAKLTAGAAGGVMLAKRRTVEDLGGMAALKGALIDDCTFARKIKQRGGKLWLGLAEETESLRIYHGWSEPWNMIARSAYNQLGNSPLLLLGCVLSMLLVFVAPVVLALAAGREALPAWGALAAMSIAYSPMVSFYRQPPVWAATLPVVALIYLGATIHSAIRHHMGRGGQWKGRIEAGRVGA